MINKPPIFDYTGLIKTLKIIALLSMWGAIPLFIYYMIRITREDKGIMKLDMFDLVSFCIAIFILGFISAVSQQDLQNLSDYLNSLTY